MRMSWMVSIIMFIASGNPANELLDFIDTGTYWKSKQVVLSVETMIDELGAEGPVENIDELIRQLGADDYQTRESAHRKLVAAGSAALPQLKKATGSDDLEVATRAKKIIDSLTSGGGDVSVRRLMAIRTLGELKDARAVPALKKLLKSERPFEADYAQLAIANIQNKPLKQDGPTAEELRKDIWLLPGNCGLVAHMRTTRGTPLVISEVLKTLPPEMKTKDMEQAAGKLTEVLVSFAEMTGNMRLDAVTLGVADDIGNNTGFVVVIARGRYDRDAVLAVIRKEMGPNSRYFSVINVDGEEIISLERGQMNLILDRGERLILVVGDIRRGENPLEKLPLAAVVKALKTGNGGLKDNREMVRLINSTRPEGELMAVMKVSPAYHEGPFEAPFLAAFDTMVLTTTGVTAGTEWKLVARSRDVEAINKTVGEFNDAKAKALVQMKQAPKEVLMMMEPYVKILEDLKVEQKETTVTLTTTSEDQTSGSFLLLLSFRARHVRVEVAPGEF